MTITKHYQTTFTNSTFGQSLAVSLANEFAREGWTVEINSTTQSVIVTASMMMNFEDGSEINRSDFVV